MWRPQVLFITAVQTALISACPLLPPQWGIWIEKEILAVENIMPAAAIRHIRLERFTIQRAAADITAA